MAEPPVACAEIHKSSLAAATRRRGFDSCTAGREHRVAEHDVFCSDVRWELAVEEVGKGRLLVALHQDFRRPGAGADASHGLLEDAAAPNDIDNDDVAVGRPDDRAGGHGTARRQNRYLVLDVGEPRQRFLGQDRAQPVRGSYKCWLLSFLRSKRRE